MSAHESMEQADQAKEASNENKRIALLIAVIALCLALSETLGKGAQTESISKNVEASNLWAFFQAKSIRHTTVQTAAEQAKLRLGTLGDDDAKAAVRVKPRRILLRDEEAKGKVYFSPELVAVAQHPLVRQLGPESVRDMQVQHLYRYLDFTTQLELEVINEVDLRLPAARFEGALADVVVVVRARKGEVLVQYSVDWPPILFLPRLVIPSYDFLVSRGRCRRCPRRCASQRSDSCGEQVSPR